MRAHLALLALLHGCSLVVHPLQFADGNDGGASDACSGVERCNGIDDDCDGLTDEGDLSAECAAGPGVLSGVCSSGRCVLTCDAGRDDCNGESADGCEAALDSIDTCGSCSTRCAWACGATGCNDPVSVSVGNQHACAVRSDATVVCWGANDQGQLGDGTYDDSGRPVLVRSLNNVLSIAAGAGHTCAVQRSGATWCWGANDQGQLGGGVASPNSNLPIIVIGTDSVEQVSAGFALSCARRSNGQVVCWGDASSGKLGDGAGSTDRVSPSTPVSGIDDAIDVDSWNDYSCAVRATGEVWCWGLVHEEFTANTYTSPSRVGGMPSAASVATGANHLCIRDQAGRPRCLGWNPAGALGDGTTGDSSDTFVPSLLGESVVEVSAGTEFTCARTPSRNVYCWGRGSNVGTGSTLDRHEPVALSSLEGATSIAAYSSSACVIKEDGVYCWGANSRGQLGDGTTNSSLIPLRVLSPE
ncbi:MAG: hypothetical protein K8H88_19110 [Sandaracinaceae bacterium]|nr:hypothetical protein [Sandaracinaceae bacterium]